MGTSSKQWDKSTMDLATRLEYYTGWDLDSW